MSNSVLLLDVKIVALAFFARKKARCRRAANAMPVRMDSIVCSSVQAVAKTRATVMANVTTLANVRASRTGLGQLAIRLAPKMAKILQPLVLSMDTATLTAFMHCASAMRYALPSSFVESLGFLFSHQTIYFTVNVGSRW